MTEISRIPQDRSLVVKATREEADLPAKEEYGDKLPDLKSLLAPRPGATREEITEEAERQLRIGLEAHLCKRLGMNSEILQKLSLDQIRKLFAEALKAIDGIQSFAKESASEKLLHALHRGQTHTPSLSNESQELAEGEVEAPKKPARKKPRRERSRELRREAKQTIAEGMEELKPNSRGLFNPESLSSNQFIKLGDETYSPFDFYGAYLGSEARALEQNTKVKQRGDESSIPENQLITKKEKELAGAFVTSAPMKFFRSMLKALNMEDVITRFENARENILNNRYRELKDSFNYSTQPSERNWQTILERFNKELDLRSKASKKPGLLAQIRTKGLNNSFVSRVRSLWNDPASLVLDESMAA